MNGNRDDYVNLLKRYAGMNFTSRDELLNLFTLISGMTSEVTFFKKVSDFIKKTTDEEVLKKGLVLNLPKGVHLLDENILILTKKMRISFFSNFSNQFKGKNNLHETLTNSSVGTSDGKKIEEYVVLQEILIKILNEYEKN